MKGNDIMSTLCVTSQWLHYVVKFKESYSTTMQCALLFTFFRYFSQLLPPFSRPLKIAASGAQRNRNVNKRTHCIVVDQDCLRKCHYLSFSMKCVSTWLRLILKAIKASHCVIKYMYLHTAISINVVPRAKRKSRIRARKAAGNR